MDFIYSSNGSFHKKLGRAVTFVKYLFGVVSLMFPSKTLNWNKITFLAFAEFSRAVGKLAYEKYLQKNLKKFLFVSDL